MRSRPTAALQPCTYPSPRRLFPVCPVCTEIVELETSKRNESGKAVHEECYARTVKVQEFPELAFVILKYVNKTPALASCGKCERKFFTPNSFYNDIVGAEQYLREKFKLHDCRNEQGKGRTPGWRRLY
jgi:hypothetical protein